MTLVVILLREAMMSGPYSLDLRERVAGFVAGGGSRRGAARHFSVSESFSIKLVRRMAERGSWTPDRQGRPRGSGKLAPTLHRGDIVILDNLAVHKSAKAAGILKERGAWFLFLPAYSPDLNPIEMAFSKLNAHLRAIAARTFDALRRAIGSVCDLFTPQECWNYFAAAGYAYK